ncbi:MAG: serine/threonine-protein kinase [Myxococcaceae bacterium]
MLGLFEEGLKAKWVRLEIQIYMYSPRLLSPVRPAQPQQPMPAFKIAKKCGSGEFGDVYESTSGQALKIVVNRPNNQDAIRCLNREAVALIRCRQLHIPNVIGIMEYSDRWVQTLDHQGNVLEIHKDSSAQNSCRMIAMEMAEGGSLDEILKRGPITEKQCKKLALQVLDALQGLHEKAQIVHRDIKPANIVLSHKEVRLIDFGLCSDQTNPKTPLGTPYYMAPEVCSASAFQPYTAKVDLWSLGVLLYYAGVGQLPFEGRLPIDISKRIEQHLSGQILLRFPDNLSAEAVDFISHLLTHERVRPDARRALNHPWLNLCH